MSCNSIIRLLALFSLTLSLSAFPGINSNVGIGHGDLPPCRTACLVPIPWVPAGAMVDKLQIQVYTDEIAEYNAMLGFPSALDLGDWPVPPPLVSTFNADSRFTLSASTSEFGMFQFDFNHANTFFGINDNFGNNPLGIEFREAVAHLINKPAVVNDLFSGLADPIDNAVPP